MEWRKYKNLGHENQKKRRNKWLITNSPQSVQPV